MTKSSLTIRLCEEKDLPAVADLFARSASVYGEENPPTAETLTHFFHGEATLRDRIVVIEQDGAMIAYSDVDWSPETARYWIDGVIDPPYIAMLGGSLLSYMEEAVLAHAADNAPNAQTVQVFVFANAVQEELQAIYERYGYQQDRTFYEMRIALTEAHDAMPPLPEGIEVRPFDRRAHLVALRAAHNQAFAQHYNFEELSESEFEHWWLKRPGTRPDLWHIAWADDQIVGYATNRIITEAQPPLGWLGTLGVLPGYRQRGLGGVLLRRSFATFRAEGVTEVGLGVDAHNTTNALKLYTDAGMHVHKEERNYVKRVTR